MKTLLILFSLYSGMGYLSGIAAGKHITCVITQGELIVCFIDEDGL